MYCVESLTFIIVYVWAYKSTAKAFTHNTSYFYLLYIELETDRDINQYRHRYDSEYILIGRVYYLKEYPGTYFHLVQICENASLRFFSWRPKPLIVFINIADHKSLETMRNTLFMFVSHLNMLVGI